jgi:hypothetical protein
MIGVVPTKSSDLILEKHGRSVPVCNYPFLCGPT